MIAFLALGSIAVRNHCIPPSHQRRALVSLQGWRIQPEKESCEWWWFMEDELGPARLEEPMDVVVPSEESQRAPGTGPVAHPVSLLRSHLL